MKEGREMSFSFDRGCCGFSGWPGWPVLNSLSFWGVLGRKNSVSFHVLTKLHFLSLS